MNRSFLHMSCLRIGRSTILSTCTIYVSNQCIKVPQWLLNLPRADWLLQHLEFTCDFFPWSTSVLSPIITCIYRDHSSSIYLSVCPSSLYAWMEWVEATILTRALVSPSHLVYEPTTTITFYSSEQVSNPPSTPPSVRSICVAHSPQNADISCTCRWCFSGRPCADTACSLYLLLL